jgi:hypothetical protein
MKKNVNLSGAKNLGGPEPENPSAPTPTTRVGAQHTPSTPQPPSTTARPEVSKDERRPDPVATSTPENAAPDGGSDSLTATRPLPPGWRWARLGDVCDIRIST